MLSLCYILANIVFLIVLNQEIYTDRAVFPDGTMREWHRSPVQRLYMSDQQVILYILIAVSAVSILCSILTLCGVRSRTVRRIQLISTITAAAVFIFIMILTANTHVTYA